MDVETETDRDCDIFLMSRLRLIGCRDRNSSRMETFLDVETETHWDREISGMSKPRLIKTGKFNGFLYQDQSRLDKRCRYRDSIETLADLCIVFLLQLIHLNDPLNNVTFLLSTNLSQFLKSFFGFVQLIFVIYIMIRWILAMYFQISQPTKMSQKWFSTPKYSFMSHFKGDWPHCILLNKYMYCIETFWLFQTIKNENFGGKFEWFHWNRLKYLYPNI